MYGLLPPHPHSPPTKRPLVTLIKQGRAFGVGVVVATQNFLTRDVHAETKLGLLEPRWALSNLRGPMTQSELRRALGAGNGAFWAVA